MYDRYWLKRPLPRKSIQVIEVLLPGPQRRYVDLRAERVVAWSPPRVKMRGVPDLVEFEAERPDTT